MQTVSILLGVVFVLLGGIHFYWARGGAWGFGFTLPTKVNGERVVNPKGIDSVIVGGALTVFGLFYIFRSELVPVQLPLWTLDYMGWIIPIIFILRAIGDFRYLGIFKKIKQTNFAKADSLYFSPLCLIIGMAGILIQLAYLK